MLQHGMMVLVNAATVIALPAAFLSSTVCAVAVFSGWQRRSELLWRQGRPGRADRFALSQGPFESGVVDVAAEAHEVLRRFESLAAQQLVALEIAIQPSLTVRADQRAMREILGDIVARAIEQSPCGRVLLGAVRTANRVQITVSDDGAGIDRDLQASHLRAAERLAALQGATMEIDARDGQGTTVALRMLAGATSQRASHSADNLDPASVWTAAAEQAGAGDSAGR
jgi:hypothetical protein